MAHWVCPRCEVEQEEPLWTVPVYLPATEPNWKHLCAECFCQVLGVEPPEQFSRQVLMQKRRSSRRR